MSFREPSSPTTEPAPELTIRVTLSMVEVYNEPPGSGRPPSPFRGVRDGRGVLIFIVFYFILFILTLSFLIFVRVFNIFCSLYFGVIVRRFNTSKVENFHILYYGTLIIFLHLSKYRVDGANCAIRRDFFECTYFHNFFVWQIGMCPDVV